MNTPELPSALRELADRIEAGELLPDIDCRVSSLLAEVATP